MIMFKRTDLFYTKNNVIITIYQKWQNNETIKIRSLTSKNRERDLSSETLIRYYYVVKHHNLTLKNCATGHEIKTNTCLTAN